MLSKVELNDLELLRFLLDHPAIQVRALATHRFPLLLRVELELHVPHGLNTNAVLPAQKLGHALRGKHMPGPDNRQKVACAGTAGGIKKECASLDQQVIALVLIPALGDGSTLWQKYAPANLRINTECL